MVEKAYHRFATRFLAGANSGSGADTNKKNHFYKKEQIYCTIAGKVRHVRHCGAHTFTIVHPAGIFSGIQILFRKQEHFALHVCFRNVVVIHFFHHLFHRFLIQKFHLHLRATDGVVPISRAIGSIGLSMLHTVCTTRH